jgi:hypothetical protein
LKRSGSEEVKLVVVDCLEKGMYPAHEGKVQEREEKEEEENPKRSTCRMNSLAVLGIEGKKRGLGRSGVGHVL